jgi:hypothetical protein
MFKGVKDTHYDGDKRCINNLIKNKSREEIKNLNLYDIKTAGIIQYGW